MGMPSHPSRLPWHGVTRSGVRIPSLRKRLSLLLSNLWTEIDPSLWRDCVPVRGSNGRKSAILNIREIPRRQRLRESSANLGPTGLIN
jgi:hypothetical protein